MQRQLSMQQSPTPPGRFLGLPHHQEKQGTDGGYSHSEDLRIFSKLQTP